MRVASFSTRGVSDAAAGSTRGLTQDAFRQPIIVIFGAAVRPDGTPSGALRDRVGAAVRFGRRLLPRPLYVLTATQGRDGAPRAALMTALLLERGIEPEQIVIEPTGRNTLDSALAVARLLRGIDSPVYAATSAYHMPRCVLLLGLAGLDAHRSPASIGPASSRRLRRWFWRLREIPAAPVDSVRLLWRLSRGALRSAGGAATPDSAWRGVG